jgi:hypothetical protein
MGAEHSGEEALSALTHKTGLETGRYLASASLTRLFGGTKKVLDRLDGLEEIAVHPGCKALCEKFHKVRHSRPQSPVFLWNLVSIPLFDRSNSSRYISLGITPTAFFMTSFPFGIDPSQLPQLPPWLLASIVTAILVVVLMIALKIAKKIAFFFFIFVVLAVGGYIAWVEWDAHKSKFLPPEVEAKISAVVERTVTSPEAQAAWNAVREEGNRVAERAKADGAKVAEFGKEQAGRMLEERIKKLQESGKMEAAEQLKPLLDLLPRSKPKATSEEPRQDK